MIQPAMHKLASLGVDLNKVKEYQILCLPENYESSTNTNELHDAGNAIDLSKQLKATGVKCANSFDLGLDIGVLEKRGADLWLGVVWVLDYVAVPLVVGVISSMLASEVYDRLKAKKQIHLSLYLQKGDELTKIKYDGDSETLGQILSSINQDKILPPK